VLGYTKEKKAVVPSGISELFTSYLFPDRTEHGKARKKRSRTREFREDVEVCHGKSLAGPGGGKKTK